MLIASALPVLYPDVFPSDTLSEDENALLKAFYNFDKEEGLRLIKVLLPSEKDLYRRRLEGGIPQFETATITRERIACENRLHDYDNAINSVMAEYRDITTAKERDVCTLFGLREREKNYEPVLLDYLVGHSDVIRVTDYAQDGSRLTLEVRTYLDNFDPDVYERQRQNQGSDLNLTFGPYPDLLPVMDAVFSEGTIRIRSRMMFGVDFSADPGRWVYRYDMDYGREDRPNEWGLPNPHLQYYSCLGSFHPQLIDAAAKRDWISIFELLVASTACLNLLDCVPGRFFSALVRPDRARRVKAFELPDGTVATIDEAAEWLRSREENANE